MIDKFFTKSDDSIFTIADIFGYFVTFLVIWFVWTCYKGVTNVASNVSRTAKETVLEHASLSKPNESHKIELPKSSSDLPLNAGEQVEEAANSVNPALADQAALVKSNLASHAQSLKNLIRTEINELPSPTDALFSINDSIKELIEQVTDPNPMPKNRSTTRNALDKEDSNSTRSEKDTLAPL